jgi:hypothetical protein
MTSVFVLAAGGCGGNSSGDGESDGATSGSGGGGSLNTGGSNAGGTSNSGGSTNTGGSTSTGGSINTGGTAGSRAGASGSAGSASGGAGRAAGGSGGSMSGGSGGANNCAMDCSKSGFVCCGTQCVNSNNDVMNCGECGNECGGLFPYCDNGTCGAPACGPAVDCGPGTNCCSNECCGEGQLCCVVPGGPDGPPRCVDPVSDTCPRGCPTCPCASPDTPIATPSGERPIAALRPGDLVYSVNGHAIAAVPINSVSRNPVMGHHVLRLRLANGNVLEISAMHPTADGRTLASVTPGSALDGVRVVSVELVPYPHGHTYDILPDSDTGTYFAGGVLIGSTLFE